MAMHRHAQTKPQHSLTHFKMTMNVVLNNAQTGLVILQKQLQQWVAEV